MKKKLLLSALWITFSTFTQNSDMRNYQKASDQVMTTYKKNHTHQTLAFVLHKKEQYIQHRRKEMSLWDVAELLNAFIDESDPDIHQSQLLHAVQVGQAMKQDGLSEDWIV
ncbi:inositol oxygenase, partial [Candidatus Babeliales bacterium]|nr:inositol oxygenase [Candidatus Babeliales bacterium]